MFDEKLFQSRIACKVRFHRVREELETRRKSVRLSKKLQEQRSGNFSVNVHSTSMMGQRMGRNDKVPDIQLQA